MLLIKTKLGKSTINGIGLYANEYIPQGTIIWQFEGQMDVKLCEEDEITSNYESFGADYHTYGESLSRICKFFPFA